MIPKEQIIENIKELNTVELEFILEIGSNGILRKFLGKEEIKLANHLVKKGVLEKGKSDDGKGNVIFYIDSFVDSKL